MRTQEDREILEELTQFVYLAPVGIIKFSADGGIQMINPMAAQLLLPLAPASDLANIYIALRIALPDLAACVERFAKPFGSILQQHRCATISGGRDDVVLSVTVNRINHATFMAVIEDVTEVTIQERRIFADRQRFRAIFDHVRDYAIYTIDTRGRIEDWNPSLQRFGGWSPHDVEGQSIGLFFPDDDPDALAPAELLSEACRIGSVETEGWRIKRDGSRLWGNTVITALPDAEANPRGFVVVARDMSERKRMEDELKRLSTSDPLTGAFNRRHAEACLADSLRIRKADDTPFAVMIIDIDKFKSINDRFGHNGGDAGLCALVKLCRVTLRAADVVARWGGEEFLILLPGTEISSAVELAERLRASVERMSFTTGALEVSFTISIGVAAPTNDTSAELIHRADMALYAAKSGGRNRVVAAA